MEVLNINPSLYLFGAGHVGQAVCRVLAPTLFRVQLIDEREEWINSPLLPPETIKHQMTWQDFIKQTSWDEQKTYVAIMTYNGDIDQQILTEILKKPTRYIGLIGSTSKWKAIKKNISLTNTQLKRIKCPLGMDIGGKSPQEIAIALAAEILSISHAKQEF